MKDVLEATGLNYSQCWLFWQRRLVENGHYGPDADLAPIADDEAKAIKAIVKARKDDPNHETPDKAGQSWGFIAVRFNRPEGWVRKMWAKATEVKSQGQRIAKGGRFYYHDEALYEGDLRPTGTNVPVGANHDVARQAAAVQPTLVDELWSLPMKDLQARARKAGFDPKGLTKVQVLLRLQRHAVLGN